MVEKKKINLLFRARWTYIVIGIVFAFIGYSQGKTNFSDSFFGAGVIVLAMGVILMIINRILNKQW